MTHSVNFYMKVMAPQKPDTCDKILWEIQPFINSSSEQMSGRVTMGKLQRVKFSREKGGEGREWRKKNPTTKTNKKPHTAPKPAYSEKCYDFELVWGETCREHCHLLGFTRILFITSCKKAKSQHYPKLQRSYKIIHKVKTRRKYFYAKTFEEKWLSCFQNQFISFQNTTQESTNLISDTTLLTVDRKHKFTKFCKSSTGKDFLSAVTGNSILKNNPVVTLNQIIHCINSWSYKKAEDILTRQQHFILCHTHLLNNL